MMNLTTIFWLFVIMFALIGATRGWAKELLVSFGMILAIFISTVIEVFLPGIKATLEGNGGAGLFWFRTAMIVILIFFGYQTPNIPKLAANNRFARERLQDMLLGAFIGALNGYLVFGTIWYYLSLAKYPYGWVVPPVPGTPAGDAALQLMAILPPVWMAPPVIYVAIALAFVFVLVVFI
ncbi:MAG: hypothetical protein HGA86_00685 [Anaerolineaceae bacterium]|nr:hypothetical protein [Anaerolineaceae bacterium]